MICPDVRNSVLNFDVCTFLSSIYVHYLCMSAMCTLFCPLYVYTIYVRYVYTFFVNYMCTFFCPLYTLSS